LGGAIGRFKSSIMLTKVNNILQTYPIRPVSVDAKRFAKYAIINKATTNERVFGVFVRSLNALRIDHDQVIRTLSRGFNRDQDLFTQMRYRPTVPTLKLLLRRMIDFDFQQAEIRRTAGKALSEKMRDILGTRDITVPGDLSRLIDHEYWLFPISINNLDLDLREIERKMLADGFDVTGGTTQLASIDMVVMDSTDSEFVIPFNSRKLMERILYLPLGSGLGGPVLRRRMVNSLGRAIGVLEEADVDEESDAGDSTEVELEWVDSDDEDDIKTPGVQAANRKLAARL
jgi:hypothetical protein